DIFFRHSSDDGATWDAKKNLSSNAGTSFSPQVAVSGSPGSDVYVVWYDSTLGTNDIFFRHSSDDGATWDAKKNISSNADSSVSPQIAVSGSDVYVVWYDFTPGNNDIFFRHSSDDGATWDAKKNLSSNAGTSFSPQVAVSGSPGSDVYVVWQDTTPGSDDIFFRHSSDDGATWDAKKNLSSNAGASALPQVAVSGSDVYVVWHDSTPGNLDIFFRHSSDDGATWDAKKNLSSNAGTSFFPQIAVSGSPGSDVYVVWQDSTPGSSDIFFRKGSEV
ncbi:MAG TPA: sialidase family protein, partial [Nitrososphaera sp.]|nr:sialidase family protein [Nitrososphaera sp.]